MILENVKMYLVLSKMFFHNVFSHSLLIVLQIAKMFVLIMACILDMDELKMFNSLENDQLYVVGTIIQFWIVLRMLWCQRKFCRLKVLLMMNIKLKKRHFGSNGWHNSPPIKILGLHIIVYQSHWFLNVEW